MAKNIIKNISNKAYYAILTMIALAVVILINIIFSYVDFRADFTGDQRYSLTKTTKNFLKNDSLLMDKIFFKIYLEGEFPAEIKRLQTAVREELNQFKYYAGDKIQYEFIDPNEGSTIDQEALKEQLYDKGRGIRPMNVVYRNKGASNMIEIFPGAVVEYQGNTIGTIQFLEGGQYYLDERLNEMVQRSINSIEYEYMRIIAKAIQKQKKKIAFVHGHGELKPQYTAGVRINISDGYIAEDVTIDGQLNALDGYDGVIIANPTKKFSDKDRFILDQYLLKGGNLMVFNSPLEVNNDTIRRIGQTHSIRKRTGITEQLFDYGIKVNEDLVIDADYDPFVMPGIQKGYINWYFYLRARGTDHPISAMVKPVKLTYASSMQFVETKNHTKPAVILTSSPNSRSFGIAPLVSIGMEREFGENPVFQENTKDKNNRLMLGGILEGNFESAFKNRIVSTYIDNPDAMFVEKSTSPGKLMVIGNGTFFQNYYYDSVPIVEQNRYDYYPRMPRRDEIDEIFSGQEYGRKPLGNFEFFQNAIDYMCGDSTLLSIRSRTIDLHPLDKLKVEKSSGFYKYINIIVPIIFILLIAIMTIIIRRYKYVKD